MEPAILSIATDDERLRATVAMFLRRPLAAGEDLEIESLMEFLDFAGTRASIGLGRLPLCKAYDRVFPTRKRRKPKRAPRPYCVLKLQG